jgi:hypothetical protein
MHCVQERLCTKTHFSELEDCHCRGCALYVNTKGMGVSSSQGLQLSKAIPADHMACHYGCNGSQSPTTPIHRARRVLHQVQNQHAYETHLRLAMRTVISWLTCSQPMRMTHFGQAHTVDLGDCITVFAAGIL